MTTGLSRVCSGASGHPCGCGSAGASCERAFLCPAALAHPAEGGGRTGYGREQVCGVAVALCRADRPPAEPAFPFLSRG